MNRNTLRRSMSRGWMGVTYVLTLIALIPLGLVLWFTAVKGLPPALNVEFFTHVFRPVGVPGGGVEHALVGTVMLVGIASLMAIPVGILGGVYLAEYGVARWASWVRLASDVLVGTPSIAIGLFVYAFAVAPVHHYSALAGSFALAILMLPIVIRTTEGAVSLIPNGLRESGLALGLARWRVSLQLVLPAAAPGVITGALLSVARASGETAPLLFTSLGNTFLSLDPTHPVQALPLTVYQYALTPYKALQDQGWGAALVLVILVLGINLVSRYVLRRQLALAGQL
jgi:phosphate transport system permease protein